MAYQIAVLPGDGIGVDVTAEAVKVLQAVGERFGHRFEFREGLIGAAAIEATGEPLPAETLALCRASQAILLGAVGHPRYDEDPTAPVRPEQGLLALRKGLGLYANLRPVRLFPALVSASTLKPEVVAGVDLIVVRELTGGLYFGRPSERRVTPNGREAVDTMFYTEHEIARVVRVACELARRRRRKVTSVDKANVLATSRLWREVAQEVARDYPDIEMEHMFVDAAAMRLVRQPRAFDVIVTENTFGDILTDEAAVLAGSMGLLPSASLAEGRLGLYEPIHGSAPRHAGQDRANPIAAILSAALLLRYSLGLEPEAAAIEGAVERVLAAGYRTYDIMEAGATQVGTRQMGDLIAAEVARA
jgi:3-isopropylmalate dehydrogenase